MNKVLQIGTRDSELAVWQAKLVQDSLQEKGYKSEMVLIKSDGDIDLVTPLYALGVQGVFTKTLDAALLSERIDIAVHSMKDVPTQLAQGIVQAAVLKRASHKDLLVYNGDQDTINHRLSTHFLSTLLGDGGGFTIATSSTRRKAQWLHRYPHHTIENLRGNVNTRLRKIVESSWNGAIFAAAGLERINVRPKNSIELDWMLPAPAQGAIMVVCNEGDLYAKEATASLNDEVTALCTKIERDLLKALMGGCSTPIGALAEVKGDNMILKANILSLDGKEKIEVERTATIKDANNLGTKAAQEVLDNGGNKLIEAMRNAR